MIYTINSDRFMILNLCRMNYNNNCIYYIIIRNNFYIHLYNFIYSILSTFNFIYIIIILSDHI